MGDQGQAAWVFNPPRACTFHHTLVRMVNFAGIRLA